LHDLRRPQRKFTMKRAEDCRWLSHTILDIYIFHCVKWGERCSLNFSLQFDLYEFYLKITWSLTES
jgi:hypothetical protein